MKAGRLTRTPSAKVRGRALVDLMQGLQLRAKAGIAREQLLQRPKLCAPNSWQVNLAHFSGMCLDECQISNALSDRRIGNGKSACGK